jgi:hypothetical protein
MEAEAGAAAAAAAAAPSVWALARSRAYAAPLAVCVGLQLTQQFSGINAVFFYSTSFFRDAGVSNPTVGTVAAGAVNVLATAAAIPLIEYAGRKPLLLAGAGGMLAAAAGLTGALVAKAALPPAATPALGYTAVGAVMAFIVFFELGLGAIPWSIGAELFPEAPRATAMGAAAAANWVANTLVGLLFPTLQAALGNYSFVPFCAWLAVATGLILAYVPETKGRTPAELLAWFAGGRAYAPVGGKDGGEP